MNMPLSLKFNGKSLPQMGGGFSSKVIDENTIVEIEGYDTLNKEIHDDKAITVVNK
jgi:hypothetical protein